MKIDKLSLEEKVGQMFMIGLKEKNDKEISNLINLYNVGGVVIYSYDYNNYKNMIKYINNIKKINKKNKVPIFISIDQEGGRVNRMPQDIMNLKSATKFSNKKDKKLIKEEGNLLGKMLKESGISVNYSPVLDIKNFDENHAIGDRCYGTTKEEVCEYGLEIMNQLKKNDIISVVKHFPGHGLTKKDSHYQIPTIKKKINEIEENDMKPFEEAIRKGADAIMVGHLIIEDVDSKNPCSISKKIINKYLLEKFNYKGLIITDDIKMLTFPLHYNIKKIVKKAIEAGNDIIMVGYNYRKISSIINYIIKEVKKGNISEDRINKSVEKILYLKEKYNVNDSEINGFKIENINKKIKELNEKVESM